MLLCKDVLTICVCSQLSAFRKLRSTEGFMTHNARPIQPLSGRPVWYNVQEHAESGVPSQVPGGTALLLTILSVIHHGFL